MHDHAAPGRTARKRERRSREFVVAAQSIIAEEGFEGLTMSRLARQLDTVDSAVYRYFSSKGALIAEIQKDAIERLTASLDGVRERADDAISAAGLDDRTAATTRLLLVGRWLCAASQSYFEEVRLLQMIMSHRQTTLDPEGGLRILPIAMELLTRAVVAIEEAQAVGAIEPGSGIDRAALLAGAVRRDSTGAAGQPRPAPRLGRRPGGAHAGNRTHRRDGDRGPARDLISCKAAGGEHR